MTWISFDVSACGIEGCTRSAHVVIEINGVWTAVCAFHNAPEHWELDDDFDVDTNNIDEEE
jgi:hypothetical protein